MVAVDVRDVEFCKTKMFDGKLQRNRCQLDEIQEILDDGWGVSVTLLTNPQHYLGFIKKISGHVITMNDNTVLEVK